MITYATLNSLGSNASTASLNFTANNIASVFVQIGTNITVSYDTINSGVVLTRAYKNMSASTVYILLPNAINNKATANIPVTANSVATIHYTSFGTDSANVVAAITN
jgi:hypothetical protein